MDKPELRKVLHDIINECQPEVHNEIHIYPLTYGYRVRVGCASFAFEKLGDMIEALNLFLDDPVDAEKAYNEHMAELVGVDAPPPQAENADCEVEQAADEPLISRGNLAAIRANATRVGYPADDTPG